MARISKCDKLSEQDRSRLVGMIADGFSWRTMSSEFGIPVASIHEWAERNGHGRTPAAAKRKAVDDILARTASYDESERQIGHRSETDGLPSVDAAAIRDAKVVQMGSVICVAILKRAHEMIKVAEQPRDLVAVSTATEKAMATYCRINKLDDVPPTQPQQQAQIVIAGTGINMGALGWER